MITLKDIGIYPATNRIKAEVRLQIAAEKNIHLRIALNAVEHALKTGRLHGFADIAVRALSGYQYAKLVLSLSGIASANDIPRLLNTQFAPIDAELA